MSKRLQFLQNYCLIIRIELFHKPVAAPKELLWTGNIAHALSKICNILYAKTELSYHSNSVARRQPRLDLVLSSSNVNHLSEVIFNLRGIKLNDAEQDYKTSNLPIEEYFNSLEESQDLNIVHESLKRQWNVLNHTERCESSEFQPLIKLAPLLFNSKPARSILTTSNKPIQMSGWQNLQTKYDVVDHQGSRFFELDRLALNSHSIKHQDAKQREGQRSFIGMDDNARDFHNIFHQLKLSDRHLYLAMTPKLYQDYDSLPPGLQRWLVDIDRESFTLNKEPGELEKLDVLLHGFKGFG